MMLNKLQNDVLVTENDLLGFVHAEIPIPCNLGYDFYQIIGVLNSSRVQSGQAMEVTAGVGGLSAAAAPRSAINGKNYKLAADGVATCRFTAMGKPGKYYVPVSFQYYKPDGTVLYVNRQIEYIIGQ